MPRKHKPLKPNPFAMDLVVILNWIYKWEFGKSLRNDQRFAIRCIHEIDRYLSSAAKFPVRTVLSQLFLMDSDGANKEKLQKLLSQMYELSDICITSCFNTVGVTNIRTRIVNYLKSYGHSCGK